MLDMFPAEPMETQNMYCDDLRALDHLLSQRFDTDNISKSEPVYPNHAVHNEQSTVNNQSDSHSPPSYNIDLARDFAFSADSAGTDSPLSETPSTSDSSLCNSPRPRSGCSKLRRSSPTCPPYFAAKSTASKPLKARSTQVFPCTMGCPLDFSRKHDRMRHEVSQHGRVCEWGCDTCLGFFSSEATLKKHKCKISAGTRRIGDKRGQVSSAITRS
ncbi:hypothetical protein DFH07DRAFT_919669 [Mycena maculata]|uniref:C2H2-type domain-containing protein n=1 Tax=Mycena maculata TaxID=230809 RepID=A0AAD7J6V1_9AGAR|nr:hypothetical protein DFH07DRAFT_919669 [Mycena maculata]